MDIMTSSRVVIAVIVYLCLNLCISNGFSLFSIRIPFDEYPDKNEIWQTVHLYKSLAYRPDVCFLGSSAIVSALDGADEVLANPRLNRKAHPACVLFEDQLKTLTYKKYEDFIFAINGSVASDQCMILSALRDMGSLPKIVVYGVTARDFINNGLFCPASTPVFQCLDQCFDVGQEYADAYGNKNNWLYSFLHERLGILRYSSRLQTFTPLLIGKLLRDFDISDQVNSNKLDLDAARRLGAHNNDWISMSEQRKAKYLLDRQKFLHADLKAYSAIYKPFPVNGYVQQLHYLDNIISICKAAGIDLVLVNVPTSKQNIEALGANNYGMYLRDVKTRISKNGYTFMDMNSFPDFSCGYFFDSVHLNPLGAKLFVKELAKNMALHCASNSEVKPFDNEAPAYFSANSPASQLKLTEMHGIAQSDSGTASYWLAKAYFARATPPDIMIMGSSQLGPLLGADAYAYDKLIDVTQDHRSSVIEHEIDTLLDVKWQVFVAALPKMLVSDQLIVCRTLFSTWHKPKLVAIAISPEDFIDASIPARSSEPALFFSNYIKSDSPVVLNSILQQKKNRQMKPPQSLLQNTQQDKMDDFDDCSPLLLGKPFENISPGQIIIGSSDGYSYNDNLDAYRKLYENPFADQLNKQMVKFNSLLEYLEQQHVKVVVFAPPLTTANKKLLPPKFWTSYIEQISDACKNHDADWIDIQQEAKGFEDKYFMDSSHLNLVGGHRLARTLALYIANKFHFMKFSELVSREKKLL